MIAVAILVILRQAQDEQEIRFGGQPSDLVCRRGANAFSPSFPRKRESNGCNRWRISTLFQFTVFGLRPRIKYGVAFFRRSDQLAN